MRIQSLLWLLPFLLFLIGYYLAYRLVVNEMYAVPSVIGKSTYEAVSLLSQARLHTRIVAEREDALLAEGTVITQNPIAGQKIKPQQAIFLVVSKKPPVMVTPNFLNLAESDIKTVAHKRGISVKMIYIGSNFTRGSCFAQIPTSGTILPSTGCIAYISTGIAPWYLMPDLVNMPVLDVLSFLHEVGIKVQVLHEYEMAEGHTCAACTVRDQRPASGVCFDKSKLSSIQLSVG